MQTAHLEQRATGTSSLPHQAVPEPEAVPMGFFTLPQDRDGTLGIFLLSTQMCQATDVIALWPPAPALYPAASPVTRDAVRGRGSQPHRPAPVPCGTVLSTKDALCIWLVGSKSSVKGLARETEYGTVYRGTSVTNKRPVCSLRGPMSCVNSGKQEVGMDGFYFHSYFFLSCHQKRPRGEKKVFSLERQGGFLK